MCAVLKTLHSVKCILNEEECRSVGKAGLLWDDELAVVLAAKPPSVVQETVSVLEKDKKEFWYDYTTERIQSKLCCRSHLPSTPSFLICTCSFYFHQ